ncbi:hypothetical protein [Pseudobacteriovorax antillogorgiicola]|uniref:Uncharacterized protein n=1 Tax=Pseudobacteriovorax antillogorgiicola TaxID=1513793 RepID=A0A1Y6CG41_9BACT|nr:hypothetical protein [Pseudobacteriovorax antillogorgiicola]TCS47662.1 hypothetical protein EDD56_120103 [Pseudobacteriovorax antillogorgiicola]SMF59775.1 hypothetical protein SAMN06296036_12037 [Pseudobacteriovorax antillogorgiicola]
MPNKNIEQQRERLREIQEVLRANRKIYKPMFGLMFWQLSDAAKHLSLDDIRNESMTLTLTGDDDEALGALLGIYLQIWDSAKDFNAASRFIASTLELSADELIQSKVLFEQQTFH